MPRTRGTCHVHSMVYVRQQGSMVVLLLMNRSMRNVETRHYCCYTEAYRLTVGTRVASE